jgi:hypothetical protein
LGVPSTPKQKPEGVEGEPSVTSTNEYLSGTAPMCAGVALTPAVVSPATRSDHADPDLGAPSRLEFFNLVLKLKVSTEERADRVAFPQGL